MGNFGLGLQQKMGAPLFTGSLVAADGARRDFVIEANGRDICLDAFDSSGQETRRIYSLDSFEAKGYGLSGMTPQARQAAPQDQRPPRPAGQVLSDLS